jgi:hypothetical protein
MLILEDKQSARIYLMLREQITILPWEEIELWPKCT